MHLCLALPAWEALLGCEPPCEGGCQAWPFASASSTSSGCTLPPPLPLPSSPLPAPQQLLGGGETGTLASIPLPKQGCLSLISPTGAPARLCRGRGRRLGGEGAGERVGSGMQEADAPPAKRQRGTEQKSPLGVDRSESLARGRNRENKMKAWLGLGAGGWRPVKCN